MLWAFSIWLEAVAILPQLFMLQRTGEAETITTHYLFALGAYRALYIPNWIYKYFVGERVELIAVVAGLAQTVLYSDFFYIYWTKCVIPSHSTSLLVQQNNMRDAGLTKLGIGSFKARSSTCQCKRARKWNPRRLLYENLIGNLSPQSRPIQNVSSL